jgi:GT2 family glycosyltransferase
MTPSPLPLANDRVLAVVVTHNRLALLQRCLEHLQAQSRPVDKILVIDNASTDGTSAFLRETGVPHITQANTGASGGWSTGISECLSGNFGFVWLMDDDGYPERQALANLLSAAAPGIACVSSVVVKEQSPQDLVFALPHLNRLGQPSIVARRRKYYRLGDVPAVRTDGLYPYAHFFNGALINATAIRAIGNVDTAFFVYGEELDYMWRLKRVGGVYTHTSALHFHPDVTGRPMREAGVYYFVRNSLVVSRRHLSARGIRALMTLTIVLARIWRRNGFGAFLSYLAGPNQRIIRKAVADGLAQRLGIYWPA